jgi:hypothetical protein
METVNLTKIYCKHFCKCLIVPQNKNNMIIKNKIKTILLSRRNNKVYVSLKNKMKKCDHLDFSEKLFS